jgi:hypothetical protein
VTVAVNLFGLVAKPLAGAALPGPGWVYTGTALVYDAGLVGKSYYECSTNGGESLFDDPASDQEEENED